MAKFELVSLSVVLGGKVIKKKSQPVIDSKSFTDEEIDSAFRGGWIKPKGMKAKTPAEVARAYAKAKADEQAKTSQKEENEAVEAQKKKEKEDKAEKKQKLEEAQAKLKEQEKAAEEAAKKAAKENASEEDKKAAEDATVELTEAQKMVETLKDNIS